jgi:hypothetical protein
MMFLQQVVDEITDGQSKTTRVWSCSLRIAIVEYILQFDINLLLIINVIETSRFDLLFEELVEIARAMDVLGAERKLKEYKGILFLTLMDFIKIQENNYYEKTFEYRIAAKELILMIQERLPISVVDDWKMFYMTNFPIIKVICEIGSQNVIEFYLMKKEILLPDQKSINNNNNNNNNNNSLQRRSFFHSHNGYFL